MARPLLAAVLLASLSALFPFLRDDDPAYSPAGIDVGPFTLTERGGQAVSRDDLRGKVWVAHFFYSRCQGPCNKTMPAMRELQERFRGKPDVRLVSISVDPADDTPELLRRYAEDQGANPEQWLFLTGTEEGVHEVIRKSFVHAVERNPNARSPGDAFTHASSLLVIDRRGVLDGYVDGTRPDAAEVVARHVREVASRRYFLPAVNAALNATSAVLLVAGYLAIRRRRETLHMALMLLALGVSALFLACYLYFHFVVQGGQPTAFRGEGWVRPVYFAILLSHTALAAVVPPLALYVAYQGLRDRRPRHVRVARWTLPLWLYVSVTGVVVYVMLYQLYPPY
jgi:protein SCO1/2/putative membrane protein